MPQIIHYLINDTLDFCAPIYSLLFHPCIELRAFHQNLAFDLEAGERAGLDIIAQCGNSQGGIGREPP